VGDFGGCRIFNSSVCRAGLEAYKVATEIWAFAEAGERLGDLLTFWKPEIAPLTASGRAVRLNFTVGATIVMQVDDEE